MTQLTAEQLAAGWLPHDGGPCPVPLDSKPGVVCLTGFVEMPGASSADYWHWPIVIGYLPDPNYVAEAPTPDPISALLAPDEAVTQADREAAMAPEVSKGYTGRTRAKVLRGEKDHDELVQAFAAHRRAALIAAGQELARRRDQG